MIAAVNDHIRAAKRKPLVVKCAPRQSSLTNNYNSLSKRVRYSDFRDRSVGGGEIGVCSDNKQITRFDSRKTFSAYIVLGYRDTRAGASGSTVSIASMCAPVVAGNEERSDILT